MASLFTNASAQTALKTLTATSKNLSNTQNRVATGYRINTAEDNAAYWSIATTLRSDVNALGAVKDALGLGAATVDTVYTGINDTKDLLDQVKSKLVTASQTGVPKAQVQAEITQLQNRLKDTSKSTVINSESWLTQDSSAAGYTSTKDVVGSFTRGSGGVVTIENITINIKDTKLYENSAKAQQAVTDALDDKDATSGGLKAYNDAISALVTDGTDIGIIGAPDKDWNEEVEKALDDTAATSFTGLTVVTADRDAIKNGTTTGTALTTTIGNIKTAVNGLDSTAVDTALALADFAGAFAQGGGDFAASITEKQKTALITEITKQAGILTAELTRLNNGDGADPIGSELSSQASAALKSYDAAVKTAVYDLIGTDARDSFVADTVATARTAYEADAKSNMDNRGLGIFDKVRTVVSGADGTNAKAISVSNIDISDLTDTEVDKGILNAYITAVDDALQELTLSASVVGAAKARIEGNKTFVQNLVDANNRGIGQLVDADLNEESTKLKALQVQEQLAVQALGIANSSTQSILSLFQ